jgi:ABC-type glycerol-3-phosphate transport system permease component
MLVIQKSKTLINNCVYFIFFAIIGLIFIFPMAYVVGNSFRDTQAIWGNAYPFSLRTFFTLKDFTLDGYLYSLGLTSVAKFQGVNIGRNLLISLLSSICVVVSSIMVSTSAAYFFARLPFPGKKILLVLVVATMMIPQQVVIVPLYFVVDALKLINTFWALVVPWYSSPFVVFLLVQFLADIPHELDEAAIVDGANRWQILWRIILPNCVPGLLTVCLMEFQFIWNEYFWPLIAISQTKLQPIQVAIASQFTDRNQYWGAVFATMVLASLPIILLFLFAQKYFYISVTSSGIKG